MKRNIVLIGFMGTGKSSVGRVLSRKLGWPLVDLDQWIEKKEGRRIAQIFGSEGEQYFRGVETDAIREITALEPGRVITTGGGVPVKPENMALLRENGLIVALWAKPETIYRRVKNSKQRPLLRVEDVRGEIQRLLEARRPFYEQADRRFDTDGCTSAQVAAVILRDIKGDIR